MPRPMRTSSWISSERRRRLRPECRRAGTVSLFQPVVPGQHFPAFLLEMLSQTFHHVDRAVVAAGAADGDRQVLAVRGLELRDPELQETLDVAHEAAH